jgi:MerR family transcriptional regulator, mercuric resistance operon regulatory protein
MNPTPERLTIGRLSALTGATVETIRYYERIKLLAAPARGLNGRRLYSHADLRALLFIRRSRELGFSLDESRTLLQLAGGHSTCRQVRDIAMPRLADIRARLRDLRRMEHALETVVSRCAGGDEPDCAILNALDIDRRGASAPVEPAFSAAR